MLESFYMNKMANTLSYSILNILFYSRIIFQYESAAAGQAAIHEVYNLSLSWDGSMEHCKNMSSSLAEYSTHDPNTTQLLLDQLGFGEFAWIGAKEYKLCPTGINCSDYLMVSNQEQSRHLRYLCSVEGKVSFGPKNKPVQYRVAGKQCKSEEKQLHEIFSSAPFLSASVIPTNVSVWVDGAPDDDDSLWKLDTLCVGITRTFSGELQYLTDNCSHPHNHVCCNKTVGISLEKTKSPTAVFEPTLGSNFVVEETDDTSSSSTGVAVGVTVSCVLVVVLGGATLWYLRRRKMAADDRRRRSRYTRRYNYDRERVNIAHCSSEDDTVPSPPAEEYEPLSNCQSCQSTPSAAQNNAYALQTPMRGFNLNSLPSYEGLQVRGICGSCRCTGDDSCEECMTYYERYYERNQPVKKKPLVPPPKPKRVSEEENGSASACVPTLDDLDDYENYPKLLCS